jgi:DNA-dependent RNA polymerase auxiliary subunit epsilon
MTPAKLPVQKAILARLEPALSVPVSTEPQRPGVEIGDDDEVERRETTASVHTDVQVTIRARHNTELEAKELGKEVISELTDRSNRLAPSGNFTVLDQSLVGNTTQRDRPASAQGPTRFTEIIRLDYRIAR